MNFSRPGCSPSAAAWPRCPFLQQIARNYPWYTVAELADMIAISESTPGPIGVNMATYAGYQAASIPGAITATLSLVLPSILVILLIAKALERFRDSKLVKDAFSGLRPATAGLIAGRPIPSTSCRF